MDVKRMSTQEVMDFFVACCKYVRTSYSEVNTPKYIPYLEAFGTFLVEINEVVTNLWHDGMDK